MSHSNIYVICIALCFIFFAGCCGSSDISYSTPKDPNQVSTQIPKPTGPITAGLNENLVIHTYDKDVQISVDEVIRGSSANRIVANNELFYIEPDYGYEYLLVHVRIKNIGEKSLSVYPSESPVYVSGVKYDRKWVDLGEYRELEMSDLLTNGEVNGWLAFIVPIGEPARLAYMPTWGNDPLGFISLS